MGLRYLLLGLAIWAGFHIIRHLYRQRRLSRQRPRPVKTVESVECAHCGLRLPRDEAIRQGDDYFCSREHQLAGKHEP